MKTIKKLYSALLMLILFLDGMLLNTAKLIRIRHKNLLTLKMNFAEELQAQSFDDVLSSGLLLTTERVNIHVLEPLYDGIPHAVPLFTILDKIKRSKMATSKWKGHEQRNSPDVITNLTSFAAGAAGAEVTIALTPDSTLGQEITRFMYPGRTLKLDLAIDTDNGYTGEGKIVDVDVTNQTIRVAPIDPSKKFGKNSSNVPASSTFWLTGNMNDTKAGAITQPMIIPTPVSNVSQKTRNNWSIDDDAAEERMYQVDEITRLSKNCKFEHMKDMYKAMIFNGSQYVNNQSYTSSTQIGYAEGIESAILNNSPNNVEYDDVNDVYDAFMDFQMGLFSTNIAGGTDDRTVLANRATRQWLRDQKFARQWDITESSTFSKTFGIPAVDRVETGQGVFHMIYDNFVNQFYPQTTEPYMMALHVNHIALGDFLKTTYVSNIQPRDKTIRMDEWRTSFSNLVFLKELHAIFRKTRG